MVHAVIMAGGRGERFWPYGRRSRPKQFLDLFGGGSLLQRTVQRLAPLVPPERIWVVTTGGYAPSVAEQLPALPEGQVIVEPEGRNTAPCLALALARLRYGEGLAPGTVMAVLPADHWIGDEGEFLAVLGDAAAVAGREGGLVTLGIEPTGPETGYGYIRVGAAAGEGPAGHPYHRAAGFVEKPSRERAVAMLAQGGYLWNSGMFAWRLDALEEAFARYMPEVAERLPQLAAGPVEGVYRELPAVSIDVGVMEKAEEVWVFPASFGWSDVGSWSALETLLPRVGGNAVRGEHLEVDSRGCVVFSAGDGGQGRGHLVVTIGLEDMVVVHTPDATLICPKDRAQEVREVVRRLEGTERAHLL